jgi:hypothetical protein
VKRAPSASTAAATANGVASATPSAAEPVREAPSRPKDNGNAWDPGSFGGRQ